MSYVIIICLKSGTTSPKFLALARFLTTFHRGFPPPLRLNWAMAAARCFADASGCSFGREVLPLPGGGGEKCGKLGEKIGKTWGKEVKLWVCPQVKFRTPTWDILEVKVFCSKIFCHAMRCLLEFAAFIDFEMLDACLPGIQVGQEKSTHLHLFVSFNSGIFGKSRYFFGQSISPYVRTVKLVVKTL